MFSLIMGRIDYENLSKNIKIDAKDRKILTLLSKDARMPLTQMAKKVRLSRDSIDYRIKRLQEKGVILKFFPNLNYAKLGYYVFHVFFLLDEDDSEKQKRMIQGLKEHPNIVSVIEYSDKWDLEITLIARSLFEFDKIIMNIVGDFPQMIMEKDKLEIIRRYNSQFLPPLMDDKAKAEFNESIPEREDIDETDVQILQELTKDCRMSTYKIGDKLGISSDTVRYRIKNLKEKGIIRNFTILSDLSQMNFHWYTFTMEMKTFDKGHEAMFEEFLNQNKNIIRSAKTLGGWDLLLYVVVNNPREFHKLVKKLKRLFSSIIRNYDTWVAYKEHYFNPMPKAFENEE